MSARTIPWRAAFRAAASPAGPVSARRTFASSAARNEVFGFIGLGKMGYPMAKNLRSKMKNNDTLIIYDINKDATSQFVEEVGWRTSVSDNVRTVAEKSDTIISSLPEPKHVKAVFDEILKEPALAAPPSGGSRLFIDCSTIDPITSRDIASQLSNSRTDTALIDAPMSGGTVGAEGGTLTFMVGAPEALLDRAKAVLSLMGKSVVHLGDQGAGLCGKLANNYLLAITNLATAEAMSMGITWGVDPKALAGMINTSTGRCWPSEVNNPVANVLEVAPSNRGYSGGFGINHMAKDLRLALEAAKEFGIHNELGGVATEVYSQAEKDERCKGKDFSSVYRWYGGPNAG